MGKIINWPQGRYLNGSRLLAVAQTGMKLIGSLSPYLTSILTISELISTIEETSTLLSTLDSALNQYSKIVFCDAGFIEPLCDDILEGFEQLKGIDEFDGKKMTGEAVDVLGVDDFRGMERIGELRKSLEDRRDKVEVLVAGVKVVALRKLGKQ
jgi:hypothetical protein